MFYICPLGLFSAFHLDGLSSVKSRVLNFPTITELLFISPFSSLHVCFKSSCCWVCSGVRGWQACHKGRGIIWTLCVSWLDEAGPCSVGWHWDTRSFKVCSWILRQQAFYQVQRQVVSWWVAGRASVKSLDGSLSRQYWVQIMVKGGWNWVLGLL